MGSLSDGNAGEITVINPERKQREEKPRPQIRGLGPETSRPFIIRSFQIAAVATFRLLLLLLLLFLLLLR